MTMAKPMRTVSFKLPEQLDDALSELARRRKSNRSAVVREALEGLAKGKRRSVTAAVDELVAAVDGPVDLSSNPKHLRGYGR
jgi:predicted transcriptional regulator